MLVIQRLSFVGFIALVVGFFVVSTVIATPSFAQSKKIGPTYSKDLKQTVKIQSVKNVITGIENEEQDGILSKEANDANSLTNFTATLVLMLGAGSDAKDAGSKGVTLSGGVMSGTTELIASMYANPAANTQTFIADLMHSSGMLATPAYAQGLGFSSLNPILEAWKVFRNIAFFFFIITFVVIGFMIMFRQKIGSQAVVTVQQAIPSIIIALITVAFSYAIAGLLIDLMYLFMYLIVGLFGKNSSDFISGNFIELGWKLITGNFGNIVSSVSEITTNLLGGQSYLAANIGGVLSGVTVALIFSVAMVIGIFKLFFNLLKRYISVVLSVTVSPLILMVGAIPGKNTFNGWIKGLIGNLAAFPILLVCLIISDLITGTISNSAGGLEAGGFLPPYLIGNAGQPGAITFILGIGILLVLSEIVDMGAKALGAGEGPFDQLVSKAEKQFGEGVPLGGRIASLGAGGLEGAVRGAGGFLTNLGGDNGVAGALGQGAAAFGRGFNRGTRRGVRLTSWAGRSFGANQPDVLNPLTRAIDRRFDPEVARREAFFDAIEDAAQRANRVQGGGLPTNTQTQNTGGGNGGATGH